MEPASPAPPSSISLPSIRSYFDQSVSAIETKFTHDLSLLVDTLCSRVLAVPVHPETATDVFDNAVSSFSAGIGDEKTGVYGYFVISVNKLVLETTQDINKYISYASQKITTQKQADAIQKEINDFSSHITSALTTLNTHVSDAFTNANNKFTNCLTTAQTKSAHFYINSITDDYLGAIKRSEERVIKDLTTLYDLYKQYKTIPAEFYTDLSTILSSISTAYNDELTKANDKYNKAITAYKYYTAQSTDDITSSQTRIGAELSASVARVSKMFEAVPPDMTNKVDAVFAYVVSSFGDALFKETSRIHRELHKYVDKIAADAEIVMRSIDKHFKQSYRPYFVDGTTYRNAKYTVVSGVANLVATSVEDFISRYNDYTSVLSNNYNAFLTDLNRTSVDYINEHAPGLTSEQVESVQNRLSSIINAETSRLSTFFTFYSSNIGRIATGLNSRVATLTKRYYDQMPLLRFTGDIETPVVISNVDDNVFSFVIQNIGMSPWVGWFGVNLASIPEEDSTVEEAPYFKWNRRSGYKFLAAGASEKFSITVPGVQIFNFTDLVPRVTPSIIINTHMGVYKSLL